MNEFDEELFDFLYDEDTDDFALFSFTEQNNVDQYLTVNKQENECNLDGEEGVVSTSYDLSKSNKDQKRVYKPRSRVYIPKLVKNDIRNLYSTMFANVLNSQDYALWAGYFNTYFHKNLVLHQEFDISHPKAPKSVEVHGSALCCDFLFLPTQGCPDVTIHISDVTIRMPSIHTSRDSESIIVSNFVLKGTEILDVPLDIFIHKNNENVEVDKINSVKSEPLQTHNNNSSASNNNSGGNSGASGDNDGRHVINYISQEGKQEKMYSYNVPKYQEILDNSPMLSTPVPITMAGSFTMHVDKNKVLTGLEFHYHSNCEYWHEQMNQAFGEMKISENTT